jgi:hypothetical protein
LELSAQFFCENSIKLHRDQAPGTLSERLCQRSTTGPNLDHDRITNVAERVHDAPSSSCVDEEVLSQLGFARGATSGVDLIVSGH